MKKTIFNLTLVLCGLFLVLLAVYFLFAAPEAAVEYSPDKFCHRSVSYENIFGLSFGPFAVEEWKTPIEAHLYDAGLVPPSGQGAARWHYVRGSRLRTRGLIGPAYWKCVSMGCHHREDKALVKWSEENPGLAAVLWPKVVSLARDERYSTLAELFPRVIAECEERWGSTPEDVLALVSAAEEAVPKQ